MKTVLIIGMGRFGQHLTRKMLELKNEVMIVDQREECRQFNIYSCMQKRLFIPVHL